MRKHYFKIFIFIIGLFAILDAKGIVDCRIVGGGFVGSCNPYGVKLYHIKKITYDLDKKKLIIEKKLPKVTRKYDIKLLTVTQMIEKYVKIKYPVRFKGSDSNPHQLEIIHDPFVQKTDDQNKSKTPSETSEKEVEKIQKQEKREKEKTVNCKEYSYYRVIKGDSLGKIAQKMNLKSKQLAKLNDLETSALLQIGQKLKVPYSQKILEALLSASYCVKKGDTLLSIAKIFKVSVKDIIKFNHLKEKTVLHQGKVLKLPLPYLLKKQHQKKYKSPKKRLNVNTFGRHKLRVTATAYTSHGNQTDKTPFLAAWNNRLRPGMKIIAVSRDLLIRFGMKNGTKVRIDGLHGYYRVRDKMNKRYKKHIDIYMGLDLRRALHWGRRSVIIYW